MRNFDKHNSYFAPTCKQATILFPLICLLFISSFPPIVSDLRFYTCNNVSTQSANEDTFSSNLKRVMGDLVKNAPQTGFNTSSHGQSPNGVYGLLQCAGNISHNDCSICSQQANDRVRRLCGNAIGGRFWLDNCFLRYDNSNFFSKLDTTGNTWENMTDIDPLLSKLSDFRSTTSNLLSNLSARVYDLANKGFAEGSSAYSSNGTVYGIVQCLRDISIKDCRSCLQLARNNLYECCSMKQGAEALLGSCRVRFDVNPLTEISGGGSTSTSPPASSVANPLKGPAQTPRPNGTSGSSKTELIVLAVVGGVALALLISLFIVRRKLKSAISACQNEEIHENDSKSLPLEALKLESTDNFHESNKLAGGSFGSVYKGNTKGAH